MKRLPGIVASVIAPQDATRATTAQEQAVVRAAIAHVAAWKDWDQSEGYAPKRRQALHQSRLELVRAVEGLGSTDKPPTSDQ